MKPEIKKLLILNLPYLLFVWLFDKVGAAVRLSPGADASAKLLHLGDGFTTAFSSIAPSFHPADLLIGIAGAVIVRLIIYTKGKNAKKYRRGTEYGSARWGGADDIKPYTDPVFENNIPLTQTERLTMNSRPKQPKYARNKNILVIGGSGSGKTRFFVKPSLMQCTSKDFPTSYIVTDPKGTLILETGKMLQRYKYRIKVLNTINFKKSMKYKLFTSRKSEKNVRQHSGTQKGAIEAITSIHTGYMIRAPTFRRSTQRQEPHPLQLNTAAPQDLRSAGTPPYIQGGFFCGGDHTLTAFCPLAGQPQTRQKGYIYGIFQ